MKLPHPYIAKDGKVINTKTNRVLKPSKVGRYQINGKGYQHNKIFNVKREERIGMMLKDNNSNIYISVSQARRELGLKTNWEVYKLINKSILWEI